MPTLTGKQARAEMLSDKRQKLTAMHEALLAEVNGRDNAILTSEEETMVKSYRASTQEIDAELAELADDFEREEKAAQVSANLRTHIASAGAGVDIDGDAVVYRTFAAYARDALIEKVPEIREHVERELGAQFVHDAHDRLIRAQTLYRAPEHTLSSNVEGLLPPTHIAQIMDIINADRPVVATANRVDLSSGSLTWPKITQRPTVRVQGTEKTETLSRRMIIDMESESADTYLGAGNLSWQTVQWSTPAALELFFRLLAEDYAFQTESAACHVIAKAAATVGSGALSGPPFTAEEWLTAILAGFGAIYDAQRTTPNTLYLSPDMFLLAAGVMSSTGAVFIDIGALNLPGLSGRVAGLNVVSSSGFASGTAIVGDSRALLVGETPGAPVRMQVIEPSIGGYEVGVIGAFKAISFDDERFADIGTAT